ncbi:hypothetical protein NQZ68_025577 [Dissostichus eleginoides]|nr:hypothetical protein NQZ68_025577 [Dissostichus eleginoides]
MSCVSSILPISACIAAPHCTEASSRALMQRALSPCSLPERGWPLGLASLSVCHVCNLNCGRAKQGRATSKAFHKIRFQASLPPELNNTHQTGDWTENSHRLSWSLPPSPPIS